MISEFRTSNPPEPECHLLAPISLSKILSSEGSIQAKRVLRKCFTLRETIISRRIILTRRSTTEMLTLKFTSSLAKPPSNPLLAYFQNKQIHNQKIPNREYSSRPVSVQVLGRINQPRNRMQQMGHCAWQSTMVVGCREAQGLYSLCVSRPPLVGVGCFCGFGGC